MTIALPAERATPRHKIDLSWPILILFAALLCVLIILPMSWLVYYSFVDRSGAFTLDNRHFPGADVLRREAATQCAQHFVGYTGEPPGPNTDVTRSAERTAGNP